MGMTGSESKGKAVEIRFYRADTLPWPLKAEAARQKFTPGDGIIAVRTRMGSRPMYEFLPVGKSPDDMRAFVAKLAKDDDGTDINEALVRAFGDSA